MSEHPQPAPGTPGLAVAALFVSLVGLTFFPIVGSIGGLVLGYRARLELARDQLRRSREPEQGDGLALAGLIIGWIGIAFYVLLLLIIFGVIFAAA